MSFAIAVVQLAINAGIADHLTKPISCNHLSFTTDEGQRWHALLVVAFLVIYDAPLLVLVFLLAQNSYVPFITQPALLQYSAELAALSLRQLDDSCHLVPRKQTQHDVAALHHLRV